MKTVEVVIKIPQKVYEDCIMIPSDIKDWKDEISKAFKNGTVLPEGHGRLVDADKLEYTCNSDECGMLTGCNHCQYHIIIEDEVDNAPTVIEADKEEI